MSKNIGIIYGTDTGMTEDVVQYMVDSWKDDTLEVIEVSEAEKDDFLKFDLVILGLSTWYDGELQSDWEDYYDEFKTIDFTGKTVAVFGLGDQYGYGEYYVDGMGIIAKTVLDNGGKLIGNWPTEGYDFDASKGAMNDDLFYGLALDEDNQHDETEGRVDKWIAQLKKELA